MTKLGMTKEIFFSRGAARFKDLVYLSLVDKKLRKKNIAHTRLAGIDAGEIANVNDLTWTACGMCVVKHPVEKLVVVSGNGDVYTYVGGTHGAEKIPEPKDLRACSTIDGFAFACGMGREVYCREDDGKWSAMPAPKGDGKNVVGFEAIAGFNRRDLYAAGWQGEIWHYNGRKWTTIDSPVNVILTGVSCAENGLVYICGQTGTLLCGRNDKWEIIETDGLIDDFWDIRWFNGQLYVASMTALYELNGNSLVLVNFGADAPDSCYKLTAAEGVLWSIGQENIFSFDGKAWRQWD